MKFSRSHIEARQKCDRFRYLTYHHLGHGLVEDESPMALATGSFVHDCLGDVLLGKDLKESIQKHSKNFLADVQNDPSALMHLCLGEGLVRAWVKLRLPYIQQKWQVLAVELEEETVLREGIGVEELTFMQRKDAVLSNELEIAILEFKTTIYNSKSYLDSWFYDQQTLSHLLDIERKYGKQGDTVILEFLWKGQKDRDGMFSSPLVKGWKSYNKNHELVYEWDYNKARGKKWQKFYVWQEEFPHKPEWMTNSEYWVNHVLDNGILMKHLMTREIFRRDDDLKAWVEKVKREEGIVAEGLRILDNTPMYSKDWYEHLESYFPGIQSRACYSIAGGRPCPKIPLCFNEVELDKALELYEIRQPHHESEFD